MPRDDLRKWYRKEFRRRRRMMREGTAPVDWYGGNEILWSEILAAADTLGIDHGDAVEFRRWWNHAEPLL
jgi:hypothetical protein